MLDTLTARLFGRGRTSHAPPHRKASAAAPLIAFQSAGRALWTPRETSALARKAYIENAVAHRCIRLIAEGASAIPWRLISGENLLSVHPFLALVEAPNPGQSGREFMEQFYGHLQLSGNAYIEAVGPETSHPRELYTLRPDRMRIIAGDDGWPSAYQYQVGQRKVTFPNAEEAPRILHLKTFHPLDDHYGLSPLEAAAVAVDLHAASARWNKALLDNAARPSGAVVYSGRDGQGHLTHDQFERLKEQLEDRYQGAANAGRPMLLEGGLDWKPMGFSPADMEFMKTRDAAAREIALAFGVPPMLLGLPGDNTYSNYQEANRAFVRQTILPLVTKTGAALSRWLGPRFGEGLMLMPDMDATPALASERDSVWRRIAEADFLSDEEKRRMLGVGR